ncbi:MAG: DUF4233 domain-containing protein [Actinomycetes bacterium]
MTARPQRSATLVFTQAVLALQALAVLFAVLVLWGLTRAGELDLPAWLLWGGGLGFVILLGYAAGKQGRRWGRWLGWFLQVPMLVAGLAESTIAVIGVMFLALWITGLRLGGRIDRERAERVAAEGSAGEESGAAGSGAGGPAAGDSAAEDAQA